MQAEFVGMQPRIFFAVIYGSPESQVREKILLIHFLSLIKNVLSPDLSTGKKGKKKKKSFVRIIFLSPLKIKISSVKQMEKKVLHGLFF